MLAEVVVRQPSTSRPVRGARRGPARDWRLWLAWHVLQRSRAVPAATPFVDENFDFYGRTLTGTPELRERWKRGVALVEGAIGEAVGQLYVARHFPPDAKALMDELVANLLEAYRRSIEALDWMSDETKQRALREARPVPPQDRLPRRSGATTRALEIDRDDLLGNVRARRRRSRPTASWPRSARRSTATSGSCCRRPSTPTTTRA